MSKPSFFIQQFEQFLNGKLPVEAHGNVFCIMPWMHFHVTQQGTVTPCCVAPWSEDVFGNINTQDVESIWNGEDIRRFRLKMLRGEPDKRCLRCHTVESGGAMSLRKSTNGLYAAHHIERVRATGEDGHLPNYKPVYLDIRFSNKCNFKCRICGPHSSSAWGEELARTDSSFSSNAITRSITEPEKFFSEIEAWIPELEEIYFAGGEPLFLDQHYALLEKLLQAGKTDILLRYSTNFSSFDYERGKVMSYWKSFEKVLIIASLDDSGTRGELQRKGQNWQKTEQAIRKLREEVPHAHLMVAPTVSIWNIWTLCDFHRYLCEQGFIEVDDFTPNLLEQPEYFSIKVLPQKIKKSLAKKLNEHAQWVRQQHSDLPAMREWLAMGFEKMTGFMESEDRSALLPAMLDEIKKIDAVRNENTFEVIPELKEIFESRLLFF